MALPIAKQNTTCPEHEFIIKFQPFLNATVGNLMLWLKCVEGVGVGGVVIALVEIK